MNFLLLGIEMVLNLKKWLTLFNRGTNKWAKGLQKSWADTKLRLIFWKFRKTNKIMPPNLEDTKSESKKVVVFSCFLVQIEMICGWIGT